MTSRGMTASPRASRLTKIWSITGLSKYPMADVQAEMSSMQAPAIMNRLLFIMIIASRSLWRWRSLLLKNDIGLFYPDSCFCDGFLAYRFGFVNVKGAPRRRFSNKAPFFGIHTVASMDFDLTCLMTVVSSIQSII